MEVPFNIIKTAVPFSKELQVTDLNWCVKNDGLRVKDNIES